MPEITPHSMCIPGDNPLWSTPRVPTGIGINHAVIYSPPPPVPYIKKFATDTTMTAYAYVSLYTVFYSVLLFYVY